MTALSLLIVLATPIWAALFHAVATRLTSLRKRPAQSTVVLVLFLTVAVVVFAVAWIERFTFFPVFFSALVTILLAHIYFHFFNMSETARRIKILLAIKENTFHQNDDAAYSPDTLVRVRLERLKHLGQIRSENGRIFSKPSLLLLAAIIIYSNERLLFPRR